MLVQKKDLIYVLEHKDKHTPLECALALYGIQQHKELVKKNDENIRVKNFAFQVANKLRDLMFFLNGSGQHQNETSDKIIYEPSIGMPPFKTPKEIVDFVENGMTKKADDAELGIADSGKDK